MQFDQEYYNKLHKFFQDQQTDAVLNIAEIASDHEKFIAYVRLYSRNRKATEADVMLSFDLKQIKIVEYFKNIVNAQAYEDLNGQMTVKIFDKMFNESNLASSPVMQSLEVVKPLSAHQQPSTGVAPPKKPKSPFNK